MEALIQLITLMILSYPASFAIRFINESKIMRDIADNGYSLDFARYSELMENLKGTPATASMEYRKIPIINILDAIKQTFEYNAKSGEALLSFKVLDCLEPLTKEEQDEYNKNQSGLNAFLIMLKKSIKKDKLKEFEDLKEKLKDTADVNFDYDFKTNTVNLEIKEKETGKDFCETHPDFYEKLQEFSDSHKPMKPDKPKTRSLIKKR